MPLRSARKWSRHIVKSAKTAGSKRSWRKAVRDHEGSAAEWEENQQEVCRSLAIEDALGKFGKEKSKIVRKIVVTTALRNVGAKKVLTASQYAKVFRQLLRLYPMARLS